MAIGLFSDILRLGLSFFRSSNAIRAENLVLRRQLAKYLERGVKPRRVDALTRISLALLTRLFVWRDALVGPYAVVAPERFAKPEPGPHETSTILARASTRRREWHLVYTGHTKNDP